VEKALKKLVRHLLRHPETAEWSIQGLGMLRTYLGQVKDRVIRVNVWDNRYRLPNVAPIHDHP